MSAPYELKLVAARSSPVEVWLNGTRYLSYAIEPEGLATRGS